MDHLPKVAFVFPGHGSQFVGMGKDVYESFPVARAVFDEADATLGFPLSKICFEGPAEELCLPFNVQPALLTFSLALLAVMRGSTAYTNPIYAAGHSLGEYTALAASGMIDLRDAITLTRQRGQLMYQSGMQRLGTARIVIGLSDDVVAEIADDAGVYVANYNYPGQVVISGEPSRIEKATILANELGAYKIIPMAGSVAFHSPLMQSAADGLAQAIAKIHFNEPKFAVISNTSASPITSTLGLQDELTLQMCNPVQWSKSMSYLLSKKVGLFVEIGSGNVLAGIIKRTDKHAHVTNIRDTHTLTDYLLNGFKLWHYRAR
jgi:[acyl-carrier-protein] S-malonyltransferase